MCPSVSKTLDTRQVPSTLQSSPELSITLSVLSCRLLRGSTLSKEMPFWKGKILGEEDWCHRTIIKIIQSYSMWTLEGCYRENPENITPWDKFYLVLIVMLALGLAGCPDELSSVFETKSRTRELTLENCLLMSTHEPWYTHTCTHLYTYQKSTCTLTRSKWY